MMRIGTKSMFFIGGWIHQLITYHSTATVVGVTMMTNTLQLMTKFDNVVIARIMFCVGTARMTACMLRHCLSLNLKLLCACRN